MTFDLAKFRLMFPQFDQYPDNLVIAISDWAQCYVSERNCKCSEQMLMLMTAHLLWLRQQGESGNGGQSGPIASATIDKVSVSFQAPSATDSWSHWLSMSPFGQQFMALLKVCNSGGIYIGGNPERDAFRGAYGIRGGRW